MKRGLSVVVAILACLAVDAVGQQTARSPLVFRVLSNEYFGEVYTEKPPPMIGFVFFEGEPVKLRVVISSPESDEDLLVNSMDPLELFPFIATRDRSEVPVQLTFTGLRWYDGHEQWSPAEAQPRMPLRVGEKLEWQAEVSDRLRPGLYQLRFSVRADDGSHRPLAAHISDLDFEVRRRSPETRAELARRTAARLVGGGTPDDLIDAEAAVDELLRHNPGSVAALMIRADIARARGQREATRKHYQEAARRLENGEDLMLRKFNKPRELDELRRWVRGLAGQPED